MARETVTLDDVRQWPPVVSVSQAATVLGIAQSTAYDLIAQGRFPVPVLRVGGRRKIATAALIRLLDGSSE